MTQSIPLKVKARDIAIGFFGWVIISNLLFLLLFYLEDETPMNLGYEIISLIMWLSVIATILVLFTKKRIWIGAGVVVCVIINVGFWMVLLFGMQPIGGVKLGDVLMMSLPIPTGLFLLMVQ